MRNILVLGFIIFGFAGLLAQPKSEAKANKEYSKHDYYNAIEIYEKVYAKGYSSAELLTKLANSYYNNADYTKAVVYYKELYQKHPEAMNSGTLLRYANSLKAIGAYEESDTIMAKFVSESDDSDLLTALTKKAPTYLEEIEKNSGRYDISNAGFNSYGRDYGIAFYKEDQVVYSSTRDTGGLIKRRSGWDGQAYSQLYLQAISDSAKYDKKNKSTRFSKVLNSKYNESTPVFTKDGNTVYFTRNNYTDGKLKTNSQKTTLLKIYKSTFDGERWSEAEELPINSDDFNCAHPALSLDERYLYFASDRPGGLGHSDLYKVEINNGKFSQPQNLGNTVNTPGRETFPFISKDNDLYFSSDGQLGLGGLDIFVINLKSLSQDTAKPINVGREVNTTFDDFNYIIDTHTSKGYFSSNRTNDNEGLDDIYRFTELKKLELCKQTLEGIITDSLSGAPIAFVDLELMDKEHHVVKMMKSDKDGYYNFGEIECGSLHYVRASHDQYNSLEQTVVIPEESGTTVIDLALEPLEAPLDVGDDLAQKLNIPIIHFDLDKSNIRPDAAVELAKVLAAMEEYPTMEIEIRSHTDCRASYAYNMALSERRAKSTREWLIANGVAADCLTANGYGESDPVNDCVCEPSNESPCSEAEHQANRRSEFFVTKM